MLYPVPNREAEVSQERCLKRIVHSETQSVALLSQNETDRVSNRTFTSNLESKECRGHASSGGIEAATSLSSMPSNGCGNPPRHVANMKSPRSRTVPKSFRIDEPALRAVEAEAESLNVTPNTLVNQILKQFAEYDRFARRINTVKLSASTFRSLLSAIDAEKVIEVAKVSGSSVPQALATAKNGKVDLESLMDHVRYLTTYSHLCEMSETVDAHGHVVTLIHDFGLNWSIFLVHYITAMFASIGKSPKLEMSDRSITFTLNNG
jgi:hypothetical protein